MPTFEFSTTHQSPLSGNIRAVVFDAVGTVMYARPSVASVYCRVIGSLAGQMIGAEQVRAVLGQRLSARSDGDDLVTSEVAERRFWFELIAELVADTSRQQECFDALYDHFGRPESWQCYDDVGESMLEMHRRGLLLAIASNFDERAHRVCSGLKELSPVSHRIISSEVGWRKPARQFFESVCKTTQCRPDEILFIGDDPHNDIHGARSFGMPAVWIDRRGEPPGAIESSAAPDATEGVWKIRSLSELF